MSGGGKGDDFLLLGGTFAQHLHGDLPADDLIEAFVDRLHAAFADLPGQAIPAAHQSDGGICGNGRIRVGPMVIHGPPTDPNVRISRPWVRGAQVREWLGRNMYADCHENAARRSSELFQEHPSPHPMRSWPAQAFRRAVAESPLLLETLSGSEAPASYSAWTATCPAFRTMEPSESRMRRISSTQWAAWLACSNLAMACAYLSKAASNCA